MSDAIIPKKLSLQRDKQLEITWADGSTSVYPIGYLRSHCPCASCRMVREQAQPKSRLNILPGNYSAPLSVLGAEMVGNYALRINWSDNHSSGIYSFDYLREIAPPAK
jgi:DUF971 family protein